jgi:hypothetical protein
MPFNREKIVGSKEPAVGKDILSALNDTNSILNAGIRLPEQEQKEMNGFGFETPPEDGGTGRVLGIANNSALAVSPAPSSTAKEGRGNIKKLDKPRSFSVWFNPDEYEFLHACFCHKGMKFGRALKTSILYVAEKIDSGSLIISSTGIRPNRPERPFEEGMA